MKKKRARMKKAPILFICIILIGCIIYFTMKSGKLNDFNDSKKLEDLGYTTSEVSLIEDSEDYLEYALENPYDSNFTKFIQGKDFMLENLDAYYDYMNDNNTASIDDIIFLVNNGIDYEYSNLLMSIAKEEYFLKPRLERYMSYAEDYPSLTTKKIVTNVNCNLDYDYYSNVSPSDTSYDILMIANKYYYLNSDYSNDLVTMESGYTKRAGAQLNREAYEAFKKLSDAAKLEGLSILNQSAYRSYNTQADIYSDYVSESGIEWTDRWSARAGYSEHQTGLALDVLNDSSTALGEFESTEEFTWMKKNSYKYGFILRYNEDTTLQTGYGYEPWHYRYVGKDAAKVIYDENITFDEYYAYYVLKK
jgi:D-alanyl-D-alanine carboxypeptidase